ncbi:hypothetical protein DL93DRAFT_430891 [Clavulina sp. PMI_390]|nr:hypothetical protein DL93DRAFT_430891 [Clavulina sp. PMI_390]
MAETTHSNLVEHTFQSLYRGLSGQEPIDTDLLRTSLQLRVSKLKNCHDPFPKPSVTSSTAVRKGTVKLADDVTVTVEPSQQELVTKISEKFAIDEIEAFVLLRSFLYNEQYDYTPVLNGEGSSAGSDIEASLLEAITEFYFDERLFILRLFIPMFRAQGDDQHPLHDLSTEILQQTAPDKFELVHTLVTEFVRRTKQEIPAKVPHTTSSLATRSALAKQAIREQICMMEVIFWATYNMRCSGSLVAEFYEAAYSTSLGTTQKINDLLIDLESSQLLADLQTIVVLTSTQILSVELLYEQGIDLEVVSLPRNGYFAQPDQLIKIHNLVFSSPSQPRFSPIVLAWACVIRRIALATESGDYPEEYAPLMELLIPDRSARDSTWQEFTRVVLHPSMSLFATLRQLLASPLLDTQAAAKTGSVITAPNDVVLRAIIKGLLIGLTELIRVEYIEDFDGLLETFIELFGTGEYISVAPLCAEFWQVDAQLESPSRRALLEMARDRFPVQARPLIRLLRSLTATGDFRGLEGYITEREVDFNRGGAAWAVYQYFDKLTTVTQVIPYEKEAFSSYIEMRNTSHGIVYNTLRPMRLPGGTIIPPKTVGTLISDNEAGSPLVVAWQYQHSGWRLALGLLKEYVKRRQTATGGGSMRFSTSADTKYSASGHAAKVMNLSFEDIGIEEGLDDGLVVTDLLELFRAVLRNNHTLSGSLMAKMLPEEAEDLTSWERASLVEVIPVILQDALQFGSGRQDHSAVTKLVTNTLGVMTALLPHHPGSLWSSLKSSPLFTSSARQKAATPKLLAVERIAGTYPMTIALLDLMRALVDESVRKAYSVDQTFRALKTDVLLRGLALIHNEIWIDFENWKYTSLSDKYRIGAKIMSLFTEILIQGPVISLDVETPPSPDDPLSSLATITRFVIDAFFTKAVPSTVTPLISIIATAHNTRQALHKARRYDEAHHLDSYLHSCLRLCRQVLVRKTGTAATRPSLLEQGFFVGATARGSTADLRRTQLSPLDNIAKFFIRPPYELDLQIEGMKLLTTLCVSVSTCHPSPPSIVGHVTNAEEIVDYFLSVVRHVDDDPQARLAAWAFLNTVIDTQPALAALFLSGKMISSIIPPSVASSAAGAGSSNAPKAPKSTVVDAIDETVARWETLWENNPALLAPALNLLDSVWQHAREHPIAIDALRKNQRLWSDLVKLVKEPIWDPPRCEVTEMIEMDGVTRSAVHEATATHAYQTIAKAHAVHVLALDLSNTVGMSSSTGGNAAAKAASATLVTKLFEDTKDLDRLLGEAILNPTDPSLHRKAQSHVESDFPRLKLDTLRTLQLQPDRIYGDDYLFSSATVDDRLHQYAAEDPLLVEQVSATFKEILSLNLDWSLTDSHVALTRSWVELLEVSMPIVRASKPAQKALVGSAKLITTSLSAEKRSGAVMTAIHADRLRVLYALVNVTWTYELTWDELLPIMEPMKLVITHEVHRPLDSVTGLVAPAFHQTVLQLAYYCAKKARTLGAAKLAAVKRQAVSGTTGSAILFAIDAMRVTFERASMVDVSPGTPNPAGVAGPAPDVIDADLQLMVAVFEESMQPELGVGTTLWLGRLQATNLIRASFDLFSRASDISSISGLSGLGASTFHAPAISLNGNGRVSRSPLPFYARHVLQFHRALASLPLSAERLAHEGVMGSYAMNGLTPALETGSIEPNSHLPLASIAHNAWCTMVAIVARIITVLGPSSGAHFIDAEVVGFVQLYGAQLSRVLGWRLGDSLSLAGVEEMEAVVALFHAIAITTSTSSASPKVESSPMTSVNTLELLKAYSEKALLFLQQLNAAVSYPNQLASHLEAQTPLEGSLLIKEMEKPALESSIEYIDKGERPLLASVVQAMLGLSGSLLTSLVLVNGADGLLMRVRSVAMDGNGAGSAMDMGRSDMPLISPSSKVSPDEAATLGTLLELGNWAVQLVVHLLKTRSTAPTPVALTPSSLASSSPTTIPSPLLIPPFDRRASMQAARIAIESLMVYSAFQLARWVEKERQDTAVDALPIAPTDERIDGSLGASTSASASRRGRGSLPLLHTSALSAVQDQAAELNILASRAKDVLGKLVEDNGESSVILLDILIGFTSAKLLKN